MVKTTMRDEALWNAGDPQIAHKLSRKLSTDPVDKLWINCLLWPCNACMVLVCGLCWFAFLPTMKLQLSQLPKIVGSGRVRHRRALFSFLRLL